MKTIWDYPVSFRYGATSAPYSFLNPHKGEDRAAPQSTPVTVNGVEVGKVGSTGKSTGPHLHLGKYKFGIPFPPSGGGASFKSAEVTEIDRTGASNNGKYVRVQGDGYSWVYLHLASIPANLTVGRALQGEDMYKGQTAKYWHDVAQGRGVRLVQAEKERKKLAPIIKQLQTVDKALDKALAVKD